MIAALAMALIPAALLVLGVAAAVRFVEWMAR